MLLGNLTADGQTGWVDISNEDLRTAKMFAAAGTFGGGTFTLEISMNEDKSDPVLLPATDLTVDGAVVLAGLPGAKWARGSLTGSTAPNVNAYLGLG